MKILPAIDLKDGRCVRLRQGVMTDETVYADSPVETARRWEKEGGDWLHVVDLDGAVKGCPVHIETVRAICSAVDIPVETGGGIRTDEDIVRLFDAGVQRVILGTRICEDPGQIARLVDRFGAERIAAGIDAREGKVQTRGWVETTVVDAVELAAKVSAAGAGTLIYTDTARDGMLEGVNAFEMGRICSAVSCRVIASGGVSSEEDILRLAALNCANLEGAIVGKALYEGTVTLRCLKKVASSG